MGAFGQLTLQRNLSYVKITKSKRTTRNYLSVKGGTHASVLDPVYARGRQAFERKRLCVG